ncbi:hypothetical protein JTB14_033603 [Gonioctena quinquepunctata]|nr:hypothetical protein JTB14_033603 [Gonioctena quinquepunctata]
MSTNSSHSPIPSTSAEQSLTSSCPIGFESLLLEQPKQTPKTATAMRKRICTGAEVITSIEAIDENSDNDYNLDDELADFCEGNKFVTSLDKTSETIEKGD